MPRTSTRPTFLKSAPRPLGGDRNGGRRQAARDLVHGRGAGWTKGGFDTWINNAGVTIYGTCEQVSLKDQHRLFDTNYWGVVYGSLIAARHLRERGAT